MPAYAKGGKSVCFFRAYSYLTLGFTEQANLFDEGTNVQPSSFALKNLTAAEEAKIHAIVKKAGSTTNRVRGWENSVFSFQFSVFSFQFSVFSFQFSVFSFQFSVFSFQGAGCRVQGAGCRVQNLEISSYSCDSFYSWFTIFAFFDKDVIHESNAVFNGLA
jgi:hypothetical protein